MKIPVYMATVLPGLEETASNEITVKISDAVITEQLRGKVLFASQLPLNHLLELRSIDNLYIFIDRFTVGPHRIHLHDLEKRMAVIDLSAALGEATIARKRLTFSINASRSGKHTYSRYELSDAAVRGIMRQHSGWRPGTPEVHELEFRLDVMDAEGLFSLRLTPATYRYRGEQRMFAKAALRPPIAHALVWISRPQQEESFLDPFCGSGTIIAERIPYPSARIMGSDLSAETVTIARQNIATTPELTIENWDARNLPLDAGSIDTVVSNIPFGQQILRTDDIAALYAQFMRELKRVMAPQGNAFLLTDQVEVLEKAAAQMSLSCATVLELSLKGLHPRLFHISRP